MIYRFAAIPRTQILRLVLLARLGRDGKQSVETNNQKGGKVQGINQSIISRYLKGLGLIALGILLGLPVVAGLPALAVAQPKIEVEEGSALEHAGFSRRLPAEQHFFLFGYGEFHYNNNDNANDTIDLHRFVLGTGYDFSDRIRLRSEVEFEHGFNEPYIEYAYVDFDIASFVNLRVGSILLPIGYLNQNHEPASFYSVERPELYVRIMPTSWMEGGLGFFGEILDGLTYQIYGHSSLDFNDGFGGDTGFSEGNGLRGGRGKVAEVNGNDLAGSARLQYTGVKGLRLGTSAFIGKTAQGDPRVSGGLVTLLEGDAKYAGFGFELEGVVAVVFNPDAGEMTTAQRTDGNIGAADVIGSRMFGYSFEGAYHLFHHLWKDAPADLIAFVRWEDFDTHNAVPGGFTRDPAQHRQNIVTGLAFKPLDNVALKLDYVLRDNDLGTANNSFNAALAYQF